MLNSGRTYVFCNAYPERRDNLICPHLRKEWCHYLPHLKETKINKLYTNLKSIGKLSTIRNGIVVWFLRLSFLLFHWLLLDLFIRLNCLSCLIFHWFLLVQFLQLIFLILRHRLLQAGHRLLEYKYAPTIIAEGFPIIYNAQEGCIDVFVSSLYPS